MNDVSTPTDPSTVDAAQRRADELAALAAIHGCDLDDLIGTDVIGPDEEPVIERNVA